MITKGLRAGFKKQNRFLRQNRFLIGFRFQNEWLFRVFLGLGYKIILTIYFVILAKKTILMNLLTQICFCSESDIILLYLDINECEDDNGGCSQYCNNIEGSFECSCFNGYELDSDGFSCSGTQAILMHDTWCCTIILCGCPYTILVCYV